MAPETLARKLAYLQQLLHDLAPYKQATLAEVQADHYKLERILELLVATSTDILFHLLAEQAKSSPPSYREAFLLAAQTGLLPDDLAQDLSQAAGMRNILVHMYETIDYRILRDSIPRALRDFSQFAAILANQLPDEES